MVHEGGAGGDAEVVAPVVHEGGAGGGAEVHAVAPVALMRGDAPMIEVLGCGG